MNAPERSQDRQVNHLSRTQIARATFAAAESMGISDRNHIERLTRRVIERLEEKRTTLTRGNMGSVRPLPGMEDLATDEDTPSEIVHVQDLAWQGRELLVSVLRDWVQETWQQGEFVRLMVIEALFSGGWRNRDTWRRFHLRDETAVAGIKFRALKRLRELALRRDPSGEILPALAEATREGTSYFDFDVTKTWQMGRVSCPARYWLARRLTGNLQEGPAEFVEFHLEEMKCPWCTANRDDLQRAEASALEPFIESLKQSTVQYLRSRSIHRDG